MENLNLKYFLAANSCEGFCSAFADSYDADGEWRVFIIKGGPGTGKSSFMKYLAARAADKGEKILLCPCSSDPDSLDAVIMPEKKLAVMDGTAPHTVDPAFPGACEKILNFGEFWDDSAFLADKRQIIETTRLNKALHKTASRYMRAAGQL
ncbi:MAG: ATPase, partial [Acutalibacteraceae bacterium]